MYPPIQDYFRRTFSHVGLWGVVPFFFLMLQALVVQGVSPQEAKDLVTTQIIDGSPYHDILVGFFYRQTEPVPIIPDGYTITDHDSTFSFTANQPTYFIWLDNETDADWYHSATYVFVDTTTAAMTVYESQSWVLINDKDFDGFNYLGNSSPDRFFGEYEEGRSGKQIIDHRWTSVRQTKQTEGAWAIVMLGRNRDGPRELQARRNDLANIDDYLKNSPLGPQVNPEFTFYLTAQDTMGASAMDLCNLITELQQQQLCDKLYFVYVGHGTPGRIELVDPDDPEKTIKYRYTDLAGKLLELNVKEYCVVIGACYSGSAIDHFQDKTVERDGKKIGLKGVIVTSASKGNTAGRRPTGTHFYRGLQACGRDTLADFDDDGKVDLFEAVVWARNQDPEVVEDSPQAEGLGDEKRVEFMQPRRRGSETSDITGANLRYEVVKYRYRHKNGSTAGKDTVLCVTNLYISEADGVPHQTDTRVRVICKLRGAKRDTLGIFDPSLARGERKCVIQAPGDCRDLIVELVEGKNGTQLVLPADLRTSTYLPGEHLFHTVMTEVEPGANYAVSASEGSLGWPIGVHPLTFAHNGFLTEQLVLLRGDVDQFTDEGDEFEWLIERQDEPGSEKISLSALVMNDIPGTINGGESYFHKTLRVMGGVDVTFSTFEMINTVVHLVGNPVVQVDPFSYTYAELSAIQADPAIPLAISIEGEIYWDDSVVIEPTSGLMLDGIYGDIRGGGVFRSEDDGLILKGALDNLNLNFFEVLENAGHGVVFDGATAATLQNVNIASSGLNDVVLVNGSQVMLIDCNFNDNLVEVGPSSQLTRSWTTHVLVTDDMDAPLPGILVEVHDSDGNLVQSSTTDAAGVVEYLVLDQYHRNGSTIQPRTPHNFTLTNGQEQTTFIHNANHTVFLRFNFYETNVGVVEDEIPVTLLRNVEVSPNPFNPRTTIRFGLGQAGHVQLELFDTRGRKVRTLASGWHEPGIQTLIWDGRDDRGRAVGSGVYLVRLVEPTSVRNAKALLVR